MVELRDPAERVSPRARTMWLVECSLEAVVVAGAALVGAAVWDAVDVTWWLVVALLAGAASYAVGVPQWRYRVHRWEVSRTAVYTQRGWWSRERRIAPLSRVQTVDLAEGPLARLFGLATLTVTTASAAGALQIDGLDRATALALSEDLTARAQAAEGDAT